MKTAHKKGVPGKPKARPRARVTEAKNANLDMNEIVKLLGQWTEQEDGACFIAFWGPHMDDAFEIAGGIAEVCMDGFSRNQGYGYCCIGDSVHFEADSDFLDEIEKEVIQLRKQFKVVACPYGHIFGMDNDTQDACEDCPVWDACEEAEKEHPLRRARRLSEREDNPYLN